MLGVLVQGNRMQQVTAESAGLEGDQMEAAALFERGTREFAAAGI